MTFIRLWALMTAHGGEMVLVGDAAGGAGEAGALLGQLQGGPLRLCEDLRLPPS
jgi:hypothetical protein